MKKGKGKKNAASTAKTAAVKNGPGLGPVKRGPRKPVSCENVGSLSGKVGSEGDVRVEGASSEVGSLISNN